MKRYTVTSDFYLYADSDEEAKQKADAFNRKMRDKYDNQSNILTIHETPVGTLSARQIK